MLSTKKIRLKEIQIKRFSKSLIILVFIVALQPLSSQNLMLKTNLLYGGVTQTPNLGMEIRLGNQFTFDIQGGYNPWNLSGEKNLNKKKVHWIVIPEVRYWICQSFDRHYFGIQVLVSQYNLGQQDMNWIFGKESQLYRYEGNAIGTGLSYGYQWIISRRWSVEASLGLGMVYMDYDTYGCEKCGKLMGSEKRMYMGPTRIGINLMYVIN